MPSMHAKFLIDSSVWVAYFASGEKNHEKAVKIINKILKSDQKIFLPEIVFVETLNVLKRRYLYTKNHLIRISKYFFQNQQIYFCNFDKHFLQNKIIDVIMNTDLKSSDMQILAHAVENRCKLPTFDLRLEEQFLKIIFYD